VQLPKRKALRPERNAPMSRLRGGQRLLHLRRWRRVPELRRTSAIWRMCAVHRGRTHLSRHAGLRPQPREDLPPMR
jgi:hypothetical protein